VNLVKQSDLIVDKSDLINKGFKHKHLLQGKEVWAPSDKDAWQWFGYGKSADDYSGNHLERFLKAEKSRQEMTIKVRQAIEKGRQVCILDMGDPLTYSPWSWVLEEFADLAPIPVPAISSFDAANAVLQKSVTQGVNTKSVILTVPDVDDWLNKTCFDFDEMLERKTSLVIFMPDYLVTLPDMVKKLSAYYDRETPIALVLNAGFKSGQMVIKGRLDNIVKLVGEEKLPLLQLMYVGPFLN
jgi:precorrin-4 methylase